jgi:hypothetical protein
MANAMKKALDRLRQRARSVLRLPLLWRARWRERRYADRARHRLAICAIFREEAPFLAEWIEFHRGVGATHFYLYDNFSTDNFRDVLAPYIAAGLVTLTTWPVPVGQVSAYAHCIDRHWRDARWIALIDIDEFLFSEQQVEIPDIIDRYRDLPGLVVWQLYFGSSGHVERPAGPLIEAFTRRSVATHTTVKSIVNPRFVHKPDVHVSKYLFGHSADTMRRPIAPNLPPVLEPLRINHYWSRSLADLAQKVRRGDASTAKPRELQEHLKLEAGLNAEEDTSIVAVGRAIREAAPR